MIKLNINPKDLVKYVLIVIILIVGVFYLLPKKDVNNVDTSDSSDLVSTTSTKATDKTTTAAPKALPSKNVMNRCNFRVVSPAIYSSVSMPFTVSGILDKADTSKGCIWHELDSRAGDAEIFYNRRNEGWKSAGTAVPIITRVIPGGATTTMAFSVSFNLYTQALGLTSGTPIKIVFTELNIPPQPNPDIFEFQVTLK